MMPIVYLTRRNLYALLSQLDKKETGLLLKHDNKHPNFSQSHPIIRIVALEDKDYYTDRNPGLMITPGVEEQIQKYQEIHKKNEEMERPQALSTEDKRTQT